MAVSKSATRALRSLSPASVFGCVIERISTSEKAVDIPVKVMASLGIAQVRLVPGHFRLEPYTLLEICSLHLDETPPLFLDIDDPCCMWLSSLDGCPWTLAQLGHCRDIYSATAQNCFIRALTMFYYQCTKSHLQRMV